MFKQVTSSFFSGTLQKAGIQHQVYAARVMGVVSQVIEDRFGQGIEEFVTPTALYKKTLRLQVTHSGVAEELQRVEESLVSAINDALGKKSVHYIQCTLPQKKEY